MKPETKTCGTSCGCASQVDAKKDDQKNLEKESEIKPAEKETDPTRFGDWEIGGRAIDF
jgi:hypothetical protein